LCVPRLAPSDLEGVGSMAKKAAKKAKKTAKKKAKKKASKK
jgi:hypothetical protein